MKTLIVGHRGTGKSSLLKRIQVYYKNNKRPVITLDLDEEIAQNEKSSVSEIFEKKGEKYFRELEKKYFSLLSQKFSDAKADFYLAVGAGFQSDHLLDYKVLWVKRLTDKKGRLFLNRPRLNKNLSPLEEYKSLYLERDDYYKKIAHETLVISEGFLFPNPAEEYYFIKDKPCAGGIVTILSDIKLNDVRADLLELRDDLLTPQQILRCLSELTREKILFSFRNKKYLNDSLSIVSNSKLKFDWPVSWGPCPLGQAFILSSHELEDLGKLEDSMSDFIKFSPLISDFQQLEKGHLWQKENPLKRIFLPRSQEGRWGWYRSWTQNSQSLGFWREDIGSAPDQPTLLEWLRQNEYKEPQGFSAVLGYPVDHSLSPSEHYTFFKNRNVPFYALPMTALDIEKGALNILKKMGLKYAAVTSPLKEIIFKKISNPFKIKSINTLKLDSKNNSWIGTNTDIDGLKHVLSVHVKEGDSVAVWGGGGTLEPLKNILPRARFYSARTGLPRSEKEDDKSSPLILIWAVGRSRDFIFPPSSWRIEKIIDLNYTEDSPGLEYALHSKAVYISGLDMFHTQAKAQRLFWANDGF